MLCCFLKNYTLPYTHIRLCSAFLAGKLQASLRWEREQKNAILWTSDSEQDSCANSLTERKDWTSELLMKMPFLILALFVAPPVTFRNWWKGVCLSPSSHTSPVAHLSHLRNSQVSLQVQRQHHEGWNAHSCPTDNPFRCQPLCLGVGLVYKSLWV